MLFEIYLNSHDCLSGMAIYILFFFASAQPRVDKINLHFCLASAQLRIDKIKYLASSLARACRYQSVFKKYQNIPQGSSVMTIFIFSHFCLSLAFGNEKSQFCNFTGYLSVPVYARNDHNIPNGLNAMAVFAN